MRFASVAAVDAVERGSILSFLISFMLLLRLLKKKHVKAEIKSRHILQLDRDCLVWSEASPPWVSLALEQTLRVGLHS